ncbi:AAA family ATPase [Paenibacillus caseinilyticus]|uniref:ATP-dependent Clp protease ATP-binding protein n=1 Tax=Paenibacillus mucilaginosus K02 TaxID=997761 RepID=I0BMJ7_9BACL|nr:ATP-dependent Clp protease ATP-binding subunit [Paenibacillus mucilaginosus]AFH63594.1 ATP-dependent Clp protease ATP-binding protein [Paenibacillus mucilaginosus K02]
MRCQHCHTQEAAVSLHLQVNTQVEKLQLCRDCYAKLGSGIPFPAGAGSFPHMPSLDDLFKGLMQPPKGQEPQHQAGRTAGKRGGILDGIGRNLNDAAKAGLIDTVIGRDEEIDRVIEILNRRTKNNPVLIGEPGVGKTAIAEGLALRITEGKVPAKLLGKEVYSLDVASLTAGTGIRGQFEEKLKGLISELQQRQNVILFIDEIHTLVGAGSAEGSMDAGNILKPALARGELQVVGATTLKEYRRIEKDAALERRFQPVTVDEPTVEEAVEILKGLRPKYEEYHQVTYSEEAIRACVLLSHRYIQDRFLPDKAIDLLDEAGAKLNLQGAGGGEAAIRTRLSGIQEEKRQATLAEDYELAARLRDEEANLLQQLDEQRPQAASEVRVEHIQAIVERKTGIPVGKLQQDEAAKLKDLARHLEAKVIGQPEAVRQVARAVRRSRAGLAPKNKPIASFLFVGPTGVGKTELSKSLAEELFGSADAMIRLDMSEYMEKHSVSKLIGSPPGYVGHEEAGQLTERVRRNPYSIILLDEIEKAHPDVQHMFLQVLEDGRLTDSQGRTVSFKDTVIIMTSNAGVTDRKKITVGFSAEKSTQTGSLPESLGSYFRPEFLNRFDAIIPFASLQETDLIRIVDKMLAEVTSTLQEQNITLHVTDEAKRKLAELGYHPSFGARPLRRVIQQHIEDGITDLILEQEQVQEIRVEVRENGISVQALPS